MPFIVLGVITLICLIYYISLKNSLVSLKEQVERSWGNIDVILKQRFDELSQLIQVVEQFTRNENSNIEKVLNARQKYISAQTLEQKVSSAQESSFAIRGIVALSESYPELRSNQNFIQLQGRISAIEETLSDRREFYNNIVTTYNTRMNQFPDSLITNQLGFIRKPLFQVSESEKAIPNLKMNLGN